MYIEPIREAALLFCVLKLSCSQRQTDVATKLEGFQGFISYFILYLTGRTSRDQHGLLIRV